jgi:hypothetical protein
MRFMFAFFLIVHGCVAESGARYLAFTRMLPFMPAS